MFPILYEELLKNIHIIKTPVLFIACASFENRCKSYIEKFAMLKTKLKITWCIFQIIDNLSEYKNECLSKQKENFDEISKILENDQIQCPEIDIFNVGYRPEEKLIEYVEKFLQNDYKTIIFDITTIPKRCYIPFLIWLVNNKIIQSDLLILYAKPKDYVNSILEEEPMPPETIYGNYKKTDKLLWIPLFGFTPSFLLPIWEQLKKMSHKSREVIPIIGFPSYRPDYFDKCLVSHIKIFESDEEFMKNINERKILYSSADNPFELYNNLKIIVEGNKDKNIVLTPMGPKPLCISMLLIASMYDIPIISVQAKTYHLNYSSGESDMMVYWIKRDNNFTFNV